MYLSNILSSLLSKVQANQNFFHKKHCSFYKHLMRIFHNILRAPNLFPSNNNMSKGLSLSRVVTQLESMAPTKYAESWDNVGLLVEPFNSEGISKILLTNDLTEPVMQEAMDESVNMIISYHPIIFKPINRITQSEWRQRVISKCLSKSIAVYCPHTAWDVINGGINDWLCNAIPWQYKAPLIPLKDQTKENMGSGRMITTNMRIQEVITSVQNHIGQDVHVAFGMKHLPKTKITTVAVCAGSGSSILRDINADIFLTGEMGHHDILDAVHKNHTVILCNHSNSERGFLKCFQTQLKEALMGDCEVILSECDADPLKTFVKSKES